MELVAQCVSSVFDVGGSGFGNCYRLVCGTSDGDGEWYGVIGVVGIFLVDSGFLTSSGELDGCSENRLLIT